MHDPRHGSSDSGNDADADDGAPLRRLPEVLEQWQAADGRAVVIRPLFSDDTRRELRFLEALSADARYERLLGHRSALGPGELRRLVRFDVRREIALLATVGQAEDEEIIGVARLHNTGQRRCEFALVVADAWQRSGVGARLLGRLLDLARGAGIVEVTGTTRAGNEAMKALARKLGFALTPEPDDATLVRLTRAL